MLGIVCKAVIFETTGVHAKIQKQWRAEDKTLELDMDMTKEE